MDKLSNLILKNILEDHELRKAYGNLLADYAKLLLTNEHVQFSDEHRLLLNYADLLSLSDKEKHNNIAQQIVIILSQIFPLNDEVKFVKESVYQNVSNFASYSLLKKHDMLSGAEYEFLRGIEIEQHRIENLSPDAENSLFDTQKQVLSELNRNQFYSFSAPTSMGKTFVIKTFIKNKLSNDNCQNFVIVVPTRALLSEIANGLIIDLKDKLGLNKHKVVTNIASVRPGEKYIAVLTPERLYYSLLKQSTIQFSYIFIDEAHKISDKDKRSVTYYKILDMLRGKDDANVYFASPVIPNPDVYLELTDFYTQSDNQSGGRAFAFSPVVQNKIYLDFQTKEYSIVNNISNSMVSCGSFDGVVSDKMHALLSLGQGKCNLIYVSSANKAVDYANQLMSLFNGDITCDTNSEIYKELDGVARQIEQKIHNEYYLANLIRKRIAFHIGALPAEIRSQIEQLLRKGYIRYCFCTSTLLEGVNVPVVKYKDAGKPFFELGIAHGANPVDASYAYAILPYMSDEAAKAYAAAPEIEIIANTKDVQAVRKPGANLTFYVFHSAGACEEIEVSEPCIVAVKSVGDRYSVTVCEPTQRLDELTVKVNKSLEYVDGAYQICAECADAAELKINFNRAFGESFGADFNVK